MNRLKLKEICQDLSVRNASLLTLFFFPETSYREISENSGHKLKSVQTTFARIKEDQTQTLVKFSTKMDKDVVSLLPDGIKIAEDYIKEQTELEKNTKKPVEISSEFRQIKEQIRNEPKEDKYDKVSRYIELKEVELLSLINKDVRVFRLNFKEMIEFDYELGDFCLNQPLDFINLIRSLIKTKYNHAPFIQVYNLTNFSFLPIKAIKVETVGKIHKFIGFVRIKSDNQPYVDTVSWECPSCGCLITTKSENDLIIEPNRCSCGRKGKFIKVATKSKNRYIFQLEEDVDNTEQAEQPQTVVIEIKDELFDTAYVKRIMPGHKIEVTGIVSKRHRIKYNKLQSTFDFYIKASDLRIIIDDDPNTELTELDKTNINLIKTYMNESFEKGFGLLAQNYASHIVCEPFIKEVLMVQLACGKNITDSNGIRIRNKLHVALIGDPSTAKTELGIYSSLILKNAKYAVGVSATGTTLTACIRKSEEFDTMYLEAGKVVMANNSLCIIDEFDKTDEDDKNKLLQCMESGIIDVDKGGISRKLIAETAILALANPEGGVVDRSTPILNQFKLSPPIRQRFDLIIPLLDEADEKQDRNISNIMLTRAMNTNSENPLDLNFFRKFFNHLRSLPEPILTIEAAKSITEYYTNLRNEIRRSNTPALIGPRVNRTFQIVSRCYAKLRGSTTVDVMDVKRAHYLIYESFRRWAIHNENPYSQQPEVVDMRFQYTDQSAERSSKYNKMRTLLYELKNTYYGRPVPTDIILETLKKDYDIPAIEEFLVREERNGFISSMVKKDHYLIL